MRHSSDGDETVVIRGESHEAEPADAEPQRAIIEENDSSRSSKGRINTLIQYEVDAAIIDFFLDDLTKKRF